MSNFRIYNDMLSPDLWDTAMHLDPNIRVHLLQMAYDFYEKTNLPAPIVDVYLMGSSANYNWTPDSDVDVHVIVDYLKLQMPTETANKTVKTAGAQWNAEHNVLIKGHKVEMNIQNSQEQKLYVTGIYSLVKDQWLRKPVKSPVQIDKNVLKVQYESMKKYIQNCIGSGDREQMKAAKKYLDAYRQYGLDTYGELSYENIIYKMLRARGYIKLLKDRIVSVYDQQMTVTEVGEKDIKQALPSISTADSPELGNPNVDRSYYDKFDVKKGFSLDRLTLDELKALREKAKRFYDSSMAKEDFDMAEMDRADFLQYDAEIKRRLAYINAPVKNEQHIQINESPMMTLQGKQALAGDKPLKHSKVEDVHGNIVIVRQPTPNGIVAEGFTLVYFMDSEEAAKTMAKGEIPYLMVPRGTFFSGGSPITDIWKKKFQKPGTEHIIGVIEGNTMADVIFVDMITVRPGWRRNHIAKLMLDRLKQTFPDAKIMTSSRTDSGEKLAKGYGIKEGVGAGIPETDRLKIKNTDGSVRRWQVRSKDAPKTPKFTGEEVIAVPEFDEPQKCNEDVDRVHTPSPPNFSMYSRANLFPEHPLEGVKPEILRIIKMAERVLDRRALKEDFFDAVYVEELVQDIIFSELPKLPVENSTRLTLELVKYLARDFDIRYQGKRIGESSSKKIPLYESALRGEWWFQDGQAIYADGDTGDMNHEAFAADSLKRQIIDELGADASGIDYVSDFTVVADDIFNSIGDEFTPEENEQWSDGQYTSVIWSYLKRTGNKDLLEKMAYAFSHTHDPREYALIHWGWQRVKGNNIQTQTLTEQDLRNIVSGLSEAYGDDMDDTEKEPTFNIEVMSTRSWYSDVPISVLEKRNPTALNPYRSRY